MLAILKHNFSLSYQHLANVEKVPRESFRDGA